MPADRRIGGKAGNWGGKRPGAGRKPIPGESYESARRRKEIALADLREYEAKRRGGQLLDAQAAERVWRDFLRELRNALLAVPARVRARLPHLTAHDVQVLDEEIRAALTALADNAGAASSATNGTRLSTSEP